MACRNDSTRSPCPSWEPPQSLGKVEIYLGWFVKKGKNGCLCWMKTRIYPVYWELSPFTCQWLNQAWTLSVDSNFPNFPSRSQSSEKKPKELGSVVLSLTMCFIVGSSGFTLPLVTGGVAALFAALRFAVKYKSWIPKDFLRKREQALSETDSDWVD